jgi:hypothetical protein
MADEITQSTVGRPTIRTEETVKKLEEILKLGASDLAACAYAGISRETFYSWIKDDDEFSDRIDNARNYPIIAARNVIVTSIIRDKNVDSAKWYIEKHDVKQQGNQQNTQVNVFAMLKDKYTIKDPEVKTETIINGETTEQHGQTEL